MSTRTNKELLEEYKEELSELNEQIRYYMTIRMRFEQEMRYATKDNCSIMMSAIDNNQLTEIHAPIKLNDELSIRVIGVSLNYCAETLDKLKARVKTIEQKIKELDAKVRKENKALYGDL